LDGKEGSTKHRYSVGTKITLGSLRPLTRSPKVTATSAPAKKIKKKNVGIGVKLPNRFELNGVLERILIIEKLGGEPIDLKIGCIAAIYSCVSFNFMRSRTIFRTDLPLYH
jgi:hypothetical protein